MKTVIKIKFVDFWSGFDKRNNDFIEILSQRYQIEFSDNPDYIFYSCFGYEHLKYNCIRIFYSGECMTPNFNECDYAISFDRLEFGDRYIRIPLYKLFQYKEDYKNLYDRDKIASKELSPRNNFCSFVYSNCFAQDARTQIFELLNQYKQVASGGRYKNNIGGAVADKKSFQSTCKFAIAFENTSHDGYCTEKLMEAFAAGTIPIYYGDPKVAEEFNPKAFVNCHEFATLDEVVQKVVEIDNNNSLYEQMRKEFPFVDVQFKDNGLSGFLYHIFEQDISDAYRRPFSAHPIKFEKAQLRHAFFESRIYTFYVKLKNLYIRFKTGTMLTYKRTK